MASRDGDNRPDGHRRKWDRNEYEKKAKARAREERGDNAEDQEYSKRTNAKKESKHHTDRNPREKETEEDEDWDALDEDWEGYKGTYIASSRPIAGKPLDNLAGIIFLPHNHRPSIFRLWKT